MTAHARTVVLIDCVAYYLKDDEHGATEWSDHVLLSTRSRMGRDYAPDESAINLANCGSPGANVTLFASSRQRENAIWRTRAWGTTCLSFM
jgi:hypothetical protein